MNATAAPLLVRLGRADASGASWRSGAGADAMRRAARSLLGSLARALGVPVGPWPKDAQGAPLPVRDGAGAPWYWAVSHSRGLVAAGLSRGGRFGLDLESDDREPSRHVAERLAALGVPAGELADPGALRAAWTRTEAVLKANGHGLGRLSDVRHLPPTGEDAEFSSGSRLEFAGVPVATRTFLVPGGCLTVAAPGPLVPPVELRSR